MNPQGKAHAHDDLPTSVRDLKRALDEAIKRIPLSYRQVAGRARCSPDTVSRAVSSRDMPSEQTFKKILRACGNPPLRDPLYRNDWQVLWQRAEYDAKAKPSIGGSDVPSAPKENASPDKLRHYFLAGSHVGNRMALLPLSEESDAGMYWELVGELREIGLGLEELAPLVDLGHQLDRLPSAERGEARGVIMSFGRSMDTVPELVQRRAAPGELGWFTLGRFLYQIAVLSVIGSRISDDDGARREAVDGCHIARITLEHLSQSMDMPLGIKAALDQFLHEVNDGLSGDDLFLSAHRLAQACHQILAL